MVCKNCGNEIREGAKFCAKCGAPAVQPMPEQMPQYEPQPMPQQVPMQAVYEQPQLKNEKKKKSHAKAIIAIVLVVAILAGIAAAGIFWIYPTYFMSQEDKLKKKLGKLTDKEIVEFYFDDFNGDGTDEAFAVVGKGNKDEFTKGEIWFVSDNADKKLKGNVNGKLNGLLEEKKNKFVSVEVEDKEKDGGSASYIYGVKEKDKYYEPEFSGKYQGVHQNDDGKIVDINGTVIGINIDETEPEAEKKASKNEEYSNTELCRFGNSYFSIEDDGFYKYDSGFKNKTLIKGFNPDEYTASHSWVSVFNNVLYFKDRADNKIMVYNNKNDSFEVFYTFSDEDSYDLNLYSYNNSLIFCTYDKINICPDADSANIDKTIDGIFKNIIGKNIYYEVPNQSGDRVTLMVYDIESGESTTVWDKNGAGIGNGETGIGGYSWIINDVEEFDGKVYFTVGFCAGSGVFYTGYAYCVDSNGTATEIQTAGDSMGSGTGAGMKLMTYNNSLFITLGSDGYSGSYGLGKITDNKISVVDDSLFSITNFDGRYIINYKYNTTDNDKEKAGLYVYDVNTGKNKCVADSEKYLSAHQSEISDTIDEINSTYLTADTFSVNYYSSALCGDYIVFNPVVCLPKGAWNNAYYEVADCGYEVIKLS